jgi:hypothetical protein
MSHGFKETCKMFMIECQFLNDTLRLTENIGFQTTPNEIRIKPMFTMESLENETNSVLNGIHILFYLFELNKNWVGLTFPVFFASF